MGRPCLCVQRASGQVNGALVSSREHSVSLFFSVRSLTWPVNLSLSVSPLFSFTAEAFPHCFDLPSPHFQLSHFPPFHPAIQFVLCHFCSPPRPSCLFQPPSLSLSVFLSASVCRFFYLFSLSLQQSVGEERTDLFKISKDRSGGLAGPSRSANSPSLLLTDKQKSEPAGLAAVYCLPSLLYPSLFSSCGGVDC